MKKQFFNQIPSTKVTSIKKPQLIDAFEKIRTDWLNHLEKFGIKLPKENTAKWYQLAVLKHFERQAIHKKDIAQLIANITSKPPTDQQIRHLSTQGGWFILNQGGKYEIDGVCYYNVAGCHVLITTKETYPNSTLERRATISDGDWETILKKYDNTCASCGAKNGKPHRFDPNTTTVLEKGHMNPNKPLAPGNIIPQCSWCNRTARNDFTFDAQGRPRAVASIRPVKRSDDEVKQKIKKWFEESDRR